jgi:UDP-N-acetylglucosamine--N-acetylmuramyl-(pentapeptide) pyrophosphoryl-undecaprenol N-acetylglucosamine transferase
VSFAIAAAGTGGHVFPGLAVGEALVASGVSRDEILFIGGDRLESQVCPDAGFPFFGVELAGLQRRLTLSNLTMPAVVMRATRAIAAKLRDRQVGVMLGMGGYVTVPAGLGTARSKTRLFIHEQNAEAGLANRLMGSRAVRVFGSFPRTERLPQAEWVGNPVRDNLARFDRAALRLGACERYGLDPRTPVLGVFGGSLGARVLNRAVTDLTSTSQPFQVLHLAGSSHAKELLDRAAGREDWRVIGFEPEMHWFYAATDLVVARAGGAVAELTVTATPSVLVPGGFGSGAHQRANAAALVGVGAAVLVPEGRIAELAATILRLMADSAQRDSMARACATLARPRAARDLATAMVEAHG